MKKILLLLLLVSVVMTGCFSKKTSEAISTATFTESERTIWSNLITAYPSLVVSEGGTVNVTSSTVNENTLKFTFSCSASYDEMFAGSNYTFEIEKTNGIYYLNVYVNSDLIAIQSASSLQDIVDGNTTDEYDSFTTVEQSEFNNALTSGSQKGDWWNNATVTINVTSKLLYSYKVNTANYSPFVAGTNYEVRFVKVSGVYYIKEYVNGVYKYLGKGSSVTQLLGNAESHTLVDGADTF